MKKYILIALCLSFSFISAKAQDATSWSVDGSHSSVNFAIKHFFSDVTGTIKNFEGKLNFDAANLNGSSTEFVFPVTGLDTGNEKRDGHLRGDDFFDAAKYPTMKFVSTGFTKVDDNNFIAKGNLTIKEVTKEISVPFKVLGQMDHPRKKGSQLMGMSAKVTINRNDFGVGTGNFAATSTLGNEVTVTVNMELVSK